MSYQSLTIVGRVGREPEFNYTSTGVAVCKFSVAVSKVTGKGDSKQEKTTWFKVVLWRERAENLNKYIHKGDQIMIVGEVDTSAYIAKDGSAAASLELTAHEVRLLGSKESSGRGASNPASNGGDDESGDVPF